MRIKLKKRCTSLLKLLEKRNLFTAIMALFLLIFTICNAFLPLPTEAATDTREIVLHKRIFRDVNIDTEDKESYEYQNDGLEITEDHDNSGEKPAVVSGATALNKAIFEVFDVTDYYNGQQMSVKEFVEKFLNMPLSQTHKLAEQEGFQEVAGSPITTQEHHQYGKGIATIELPRYHAAGQDAVYLIIETGVEISVEYNIDVEKFSRPLVIFFPMMNPLNQNQELETIHIYPKNIGYYRDPYFFKYGAVKGAEADSVKPLEGVVFAMYQIFDGEKQYLDLSSVNDLGNRWMPSDDPLNDDEVTKFTSNKDGLVDTGPRFFGAGTYYFEELKTIADYEISDDDRRIEVIIPPTWDDPVTVNGQVMFENIDGSIPKEAYEKIIPVVTNYRPIPPKKPAAGGSKPFPKVGERTNSLYWMGLSIILFVLLAWRIKSKKHR